MREFEAGAVLPPSEEVERLKQNLAALVKAEEAYRATERSEPRWVRMTSVDTLGPACDHEASALILTMPRGGWREGAGRPAAYPNKDLDDSFSMDFTEKGRRAFDRVQARTGLSRNDIMAHLALMHADDLAFRADGVVFPGKSQNVYRICLPAAAGDQLLKAQRRTGKGFSDLGEALVRWYGVTEVFPVLPGKDRPTLRRRRRRQRGRR